MAKEKARMCVNCKYASYQFKIGGLTHVCCNHPDENVRGEPGWDQLREFYDKYYNKIHNCFEVKNTGVPG